MLNLLLHTANRCGYNWRCLACQQKHGIVTSGMQLLMLCPQTSTKTLLEEPRAELTALHTMKLLVEHALTTKVHGNAIAQTKQLPWTGLLTANIASCLLHGHMKVHRVPYDPHKNELLAA